MRSILLPLAFLAGTGCVTTGKFETVQADLEATRAALAANEQAWEAERAAWEAERAERDQREAALKSELEATREKLATAEATLADTAKQLEEVNAQLAKVLKDRTALKASVEEMQKALADAQKAEVLEARLKDKEAVIQQLRFRLQDAEARLEAAGREAEQLRAEVAKLQQEKAQLLQARSELKASVEEMQQALATLAEQKAQAEARLAELRKVVEQLKPLIDAGQLKVKVVDGRLVVQLPSDVLFASGSASLSKEGEEAIRAVAPVLAQVPDRTFLVEGHTDNVPISTAKYPDNWALAAARANTVVRTLIDAGVPPERLAAAAYADTRPVASNDTPEGRALNRRIEIAILPDLSKLPGAKELEEALGEGAPSGEAAPAASPDEG